MENQKIDVEISEDECQRIMDGEEFNWVFPVKVKSTGEIIDVEVNVLPENTEY